MVQATVQELIRQGLIRASSLRHEMQLEASGNNTARYRCQLCQLEFQVGYLLAPSRLDLFGSGITTRCQGYASVGAADSGG